MVMEDKAAEVHVDIPVDNLQLLVVQRVEANVILQLASKLVADSNSKAPMA